MEHSKAAETGRTWLIADTHFNHAGPMVRPISEGGCGRPADHTQRTIANWQRLVQPEDLVIHIGDVIVGRASELAGIMASLPGRKWLVRGNHDGQKASWYTARGFEEVFDRLQLQYAAGGEAHGPLSVKIVHDPERLEDDELVAGCTHYIHGHWHNSTPGPEWPGWDWYNNGNDRPAYCDFYRCFILEDLDYSPVLLPDFLRLPVAVGCNPWTS